jgi:glutamine synthetase
MDKKELLERVSADGVKFISYQFTDVGGAVKSVDGPVNRLTEALEKGIWFDGSSVEGFTRIQESDMHLRIDPDTYAVLPWTPIEMRRARVICDIYTPDGDPFAGDPRGLLKHKMEEAYKRGFIFKVGPEPEFFLFRRNDGDSIRPVPHDVGGYFDFSPNDEAVRVRTELMSVLSVMGLDVEVGHHEVALGQHVIDFKYDDAVRAADNVLTLKYTVKAIAAQHGLIASFMPKPILGVNGSGMHIHQSLFDVNGNNLFFNARNEFKLSTLALEFIAGQLKHARALSGIVASSVNSYKRLVPGFEAPVYIGWAQTNRSALIRIPRYTPGMDNDTHVELRCPDPSCNPYMAISAIFAAGMDGIDSKLIAPNPLNNINIYQLTEKERARMKIASLPSSLGEALNELDKDTVIKTALGEYLYEAFTREKWAEWDNYRMHITDWEVEHYLEVS